MQPTSTEIAHAEDYRIRHGVTLDKEWKWDHLCYDCGAIKEDAREVFICRISTVACRDCRPFDRTCEACGEAEALPGLDGCLACTIEGDLHDVRAEIARAM